MPSLAERCYRRATSALPPRVAAELDWLRPSYHRSWGGPMNGQARRQRIVEDIFFAVEFDEVVETGTFRGGTTRWLHEMSRLPVYSVESEPRFYFFADRFNKALPGVHVRLGDSRELVRDLAARAERKVTFFYLDAHWAEDVPRHEELRIILGQWESAVVMIDDFLVPDDDGYGYARYGGRPLDEAYLPDLGAWRRFYPAAPSVDETGARRGCLVIASPDLAGKIECLSGLRRG